MHKILLVATVVAALFTAPLAAAAADGDHDGVDDAMDKCPFTQTDALIDPQGCALDSDVDQVADGLDRCPDTAPGVAVSEEGCAAGQSPGAAVARPAPVIPKPESSDAIFDVLAQPAAPPAPLAAPPPASPAAAPSSEPTFFAVPGDPLPTAPPADGPVNSALPSSPELAPAQVLADESFSDPLYTSIYFFRNSSSIPEMSLKKLGYSLPDLLKNIDRYPRMVVELAGHTDPRSDKGDAAALSLARAEALRAYLVAQGVPAERIKTSGHGAMNPRYRSGDTGRNSRVEILTYPQ